MWIEYLKIIYWIKLIVLPKGRGRKKEIKIRVLNLSRRVSISGDVKKKKWTERQGFIEYEGKDNFGLNIPACKKMLLRPPPIGWKYGSRM